MTTICETGCQMGCLDPGDHFLAERHPEDGKPSLPGYDGWWIIIHDDSLVTDEMQQVFALPIGIHGPSIGHGCWWDRKDLIGHEKGDFHPDLANRYLETIKEMVNGS